MKFSLLGIVIFVFSTVGYGQSLNKFKSPTENHQLVGGTNIYIIPPTDFQISKNFKGFQNPADQTSMIMIMEIPGSFSEVSGGFTNEMLGSRGMLLNSKKKVEFSNYEGYLIELEQDANGLTYSKSILVYGNSSTSTMINGIFLKDSVHLGNQIKESIRTTVIDSTIVANPRDGLDYTLDETLGNLKFVTVMGNSMIFNRDQKTPTESKDKATLLTDKSYAKTTIEDRKLFCISILKKYPEDYQIIVDHGINEIELDGLSGFELFAKNTELENEEMYQVILFQEDGGYFLLIGTYLAGYETAINDIKKTIRTFKRK